MEPIIKDLTNNMILTTDPSDLPAYVKLVEYDGKNSLKVSYTEKTFMFSFDVRHKKLVGPEPASFDSIITKLNTQKSPIISKASLTSSFYFLVLPDYSAQAATPGYLDFVVQIFINGRKIPQRYIGLLKSYVAKQCYVLIDKAGVDAIFGSNFLNNSFTSDRSYYKILFKENIENDTLSTESWYTNKYDYDLYDGNNKNITNDNYFYTNLVEIEQVTGVNKQGKYFNNIFKTDYVEDKPSSDSLKSHPGSQVSFKLKAAENNVSLKSRQTQYEFIETKERQKQLNLTVDNVNVYTSDGRSLMIDKDYSISGGVLNIASNIDSEYFEIIPEYDSYRRFKATYIVPDALSNSVKNIVPTLIGIKSCAFNYQSLLTNGFIEIINNNLVILKGKMKDIEGTPITITDNIEVKILDTKNDRNASYNIEDPSIAAACYTASISETKSGNKNSTDVWNPYKTITGTEEYSHDYTNLDELRMISGDNYAVCYNNSINEAFNSNKGLNIELYENGIKKTIGFDSNYNINDRNPENISDDIMTNINNLEQNLLKIVQNSGTINMLSGDKISSSSNFEFIYLVTAENGIKYYSEAFPEYIFELNAGKHILFNIFNGKEIKFNKNISYHIFG